MKLSDSGPPKTGTSGFYSGSTKPSFPVFAPVQKLIVSRCRNTMKPYRALEPRGGIVDRHRLDGYRVARMHVAARLSG